MVFCILSSWWQLLSLVTIQMEVLFTTACVYGGPSNTLDDCANVTAGITGGGVAIGAAYDFDNGFTTAFGAQFTETGIATDENDDAYALNAAYTGDNYGFL